jgi:hypothetical protein
MSFFIIEFAQLILNTSISRFSEDSFKKKCKAVSYFLKFPDPENFRVSVSVKLVTYFGLKLSSIKLKTKQVSGDQRTEGKQDRRRGEGGTKKQIHKTLL